MFETYVPTHKKLGMVVAQLFIWVPRDGVLVGKSAKILSPSSSERSRFKNKIENNRGRCLGLLPTCIHRHTHIHKHLKLCMLED